MSYVFGYGVVLIERFGVNKSRSTIPAPARLNGGSEQSKSTARELIMHSILFG